MTDIILAQIGTRTWLVGGEAFIDDLLANTLRDDVTIEFVTCQTESEVYEMWRANTAFPGDMPWMIHPAIAARCQTTITLDGSYEVTFGPWSAMRDATGDMALDAAAEAALGSTAKVVLHWHVEPGAPAFAADMGTLRCGLLESALVAKGVASDRIERVRDDESGANDRIDIRVSPAVERASAIT